MTQEVSSDKWKDTSTDQGSRNIRVVLVADMFRPCAGKLAGRTFTMRQLEVVGRVQSVYASRIISRIFNGPNHRSMLERGISSSSRHNLSDRLLGYSPMAQSTPNASSTEKQAGKQIPTAEQVSTSGGVWAPTSAKRDKIAELKVALEDGQETLDDAATPEQLLDLYLVDGMKLIVRETDYSTGSDTKDIQEFSEFLLQNQNEMSDVIDQFMFPVHLDAIAERIESLLSNYPPSENLKKLRDFLDPNDVPEEELGKLPTSDVDQHNKNFDNSVIRFRLLLAKAAVEHLKASWGILTKVSDGDVDRAAVNGQQIEPQAGHISLAKVYKFIFAHASGSCSDRVDASWELLDRDDDGLLDESEMNNAIFLCLAPTQKALASLYEEALDAYPVRSPLSEMDDDDLPAPKKGWMARRRENREKRTLSKMFQRAIKNHFEDEVEVNHRLRCIYAWAEKAHQDNKLDSVLVDDGWSGRKRYVELSPKISLPEFREVQEIHFTHLDRMSTEILDSHREDLWVRQGRGRERRELIRDCTAFLVVVSVLDYAILAF